MNKNNKIKMITVSIFVATLSISVNGIAKEVDKKQQDNIKQLKELIISRLNLVHELSLKQIASKLLISELTTLRLLQDAYIQMVVDTNSRNNNSFSQLKKSIIKSSFLGTNNEESLKPAQQQKAKEVSLDYLKQYIKGLKTLGIDLTKSEYDVFKAIKTQKEFLRFHKTILFNKKSSLIPQKSLENPNKKAKYNNKSECSVF